METKNDFIIVTEGRMKHLLPLEEILYVEAVRIYSIIHVKNCARQYVTSRNLRKVYEELKHNNFLQVHKSHIINLNEVKAYQQGRSAKVILKNDMVITVAQRRKTELLLHLKNLNNKKNHYALKQINNPQEKK